jgi:hypothetical protein
MYNDLSYTFRKGDYRMNNTCMYHMYLDVTVLRGFLDIGLVTVLCYEEERNYL